jgi:hypothetical protein
VISAARVSKRNNIIMNSIFLVRNMELSDKIRKATIPSFECHVCKRRLKEGEFIAVIGQTPPTGLSMPNGRADAILKQVGNIYCEQCFKKLT